MILLKNGHVLSPKNLGVMDVLIAGKKIIHIDKNIEITGIAVEVIDCSSKYILPGFIDGHVHIMGGGGEGSFKTRTPEINLSDITRAGVTTVVGCIGTDGTTRSMKALLAKAYALEEEGITTFVYTGSYQVPIKTLTGDIQDDIILIEKIIGVGEIAISDHRSSVPSIEELCRIASSGRVGGMLSNKSGIINIHLGDSDTKLQKLYEVTKISELPLTQFLPTHVNRNEALFKEGLLYAKAGGFIDFTTSTTKQFLEMGEVASSKALRLALENGVQIEHITFTSDGQGSLPVFDLDNNLIGLTIGKLSSLFASVVESVVKEKVPLEEAIKVITSNPAMILKLKEKGQIKEGFDGDLVVVDKEDYDIDTVIAMGQIMVKNKTSLIKGTFE